MLLSIQVILNVFIQHSKAIYQCLTESNSLTLYLNSITEDEIFKQILTVFKRTISKISKDIVNNAMKLFHGRVLNVVLICY